MQACTCTSTIWSRDKGRLGLGFCLYMLAFICTHVCLQSSAQLAMLKTLLCEFDTCLYLFTSAATSVCHVIVSTCSFIISSVTESSDDRTTSLNFTMLPLTY